MPGKRIAAQIKQLSSIRHPGLAAELRAVLEEAGHRGITWAHPAACSGSGASPLHIACITGNKTAVAHLLEFRGASASDFIDRKDGFGNTAVIAAAGRGRAGCVELLLLAGANPNIKTKSGYTGARAIPQPFRLHLCHCELKC